MEYLSLIVSFISGGGFLMLVNWKINKKTQKLDFADKAIGFAEKQSGNYIKRIEQLEADVKKLFVFKCEKIECTNRQPPKIDE